MSNRNAYILGVLAALLMLFFGYMLYVQSTTPPTKAELARREAAARQRAQDQLIEQVRRDVQSSLRDPASAQFGRMWVASSGIVCGSVNARNGFGGMTGQVPFASRGGIVAMEHPGDESWNKAMREVQPWFKNCWN